MTQWELNEKLDKIIEDNIKEIPYEGKEVDNYGLKQDIIDFIKTLSYTDLSKIIEMI
jgi:hypothetical protein